MQIIDIIFVIAVIVMSAVIHEVMHGVAADKLGDPTARYAGRLTLNPLRHLDPFGSVILPAILAFTHSPVLLGWAKPVPYNPHNLRPGRFSEAIVAGAGPASNLAIALLGALAIRSDLFGEMGGIIFTIVLINIMLFLFNMIPLPPLDGSKVLEALLPLQLQYGYANLRARMEHNPFLGMGVIVLFILFFGSTFGSIIYSLAHLLAGT